MAKKRFLHIMPDDKFLDYFIQQSEEVAPGNSVYWVKLKTKEPVHVKSKLIDSFYWNARSIEELVQEANQYDRIFLHSFTLDMTNFILKLSPASYITWMFWGYEGYSYTSNKKKWFLSETLLLRKKYFRKKWNSLSGVYLNLKRLYVDSLNKKKTNEILHRINCCATWVKYDYEMIRVINPKMEWRDYNYFSISQLGLDLITKQENDYTNIWVGNSGALTNNHADALLELHKRNWKGEVYMPMVYGGTPLYSQEIMKMGKKFFGARFHALTDFLPLSEYQQLLNKCGLIWMNHIRQQAAGNVLAALHMGKAVILHPSSNLYKTLISWNVTLYTSLSDFDRQGINDQLYKINKEIIQNHISYQHSLKCVKNLYADRS